MIIEEISDFASAKQGHNVYTGSATATAAAAASRDDGESPTQQSSLQQQAPKVYRNPLTKKMIVDACIKNGFYRTPSCNERLYLHFMGIDTLGGDALEEYSEVVCGWLEGNCLSSLDGIRHMPKLRCLYLHQNMLEKLEPAADLAALQHLDSLNLSDNYIRKIENLDAQAESLATLQIKNNKLRDQPDYEQLVRLKKLRTLDVSNNDIQSGAELLEILAQMPELKALYVAGNPFVREMRNMRKTMLAALPQLLHMDEKPVFADERRLVTAWKRGGMEAEREERKKLKDEELAQAQQRLTDFRKLMADAKMERKDEDESENKKKQRNESGEDAASSSSYESEEDSNPTASDEDDEKQQQQEHDDENKRDDSDSAKKKKKEKSAKDNTGSKSATTFNNRRGATKRTLTSNNTDGTVAVGELNDALVARQQQQREAAASEAHRASAVVRRPAAASVHVDAAAIEAAQSHMRAQQEAAAAELQKGGEEDGLDDVYMG